MSLSKRAVLVYLGVSIWKGRKIDRRATGEVERNFATDGKVGNYTKKLLPGAEALERVDAMGGAIRKWVATQTLPWLSDGTRILPSENMFDFVREFAKRKAAFDARVDAFILEYPLLRTAAASKLGSLFNDIEYPTAETLHAKFKCDVTYMPLPDGTDWRVQVTESEKQRYLADLASVETRATRECFERLREVIQKAAAKLAEPDRVLTDKHGNTYTAPPIFRDSLFENVAELCQLLPKLNVTDDVNLSQAIADVSSIVSKVSPDTCRENPTERTEVAKKLADIDAKMAAFMGVLK